MISIRPYLCAREYAEKGFDGIIPVKSAGCMPEIDVMPVLQNISEDSKVPILYLTYDSQTSSTKEVIIDSENQILAREYIWTEGDPIRVVKRQMIPGTIE